MPVISVTVAITVKVQKEKLAPGNGIRCPFISYLKWGIDPVPCVKEATARYFLGTHERLSCDGHGGANIYEGEGALCHDIQAEREVAQAFVDEKWLSCMAMATKKGNGS